VIFRTRACKVLVVDADRDASHALSVRAELLGCDTRIALDARSARAVAALFAPDVALVAARLPDGDSLALGRLLRARDAVRSLVVVATARCWVEPRRALAAGFDRVVTTPIDRETLAAIVRISAK
jgi:DNA-binding response OmpR family regulator